MCLLLGLFLAVSSLYAQDLKLTPIEIKGNSFHQDGKSLKPNQELQSVLAQARCDEIDASIRKAKSLQTTGTIVMGAGVGLMGLSLLSQSEGNSSTGLLLGGAVVELVGIGIMLPANKHRKRAVKAYNVIAGGGKCGG